MEASHKKHRPHIKVEKYAEEQSKEKYGFSPDVLILDVVLLGIASSPSQHSHLSNIVCNFCVSFFLTAQLSDPYIIADLTIVL